MRKSIALLLGLSLATLTACEQAAGNSGAASSGCPQVPLFRKLCPMLPRPRRKHLRSPPRYHHRAAQCAGWLCGFFRRHGRRQPEMRPRGGSAGGIPELRRHRRLHRRRLDDRPDPGPARPVGHQLGRAFWPMPKTSPPIQPARPTFYPAPVSPRILPAWF